ncbi:MAG: hypothetical protein M5T61_14975 [Acidimicrobiia bacterium]|nr:hypothetical protein [Acidimicrobiia bacterium]
MRMFSQNRSATGSRVRQAARIVAAVAAFALVAGACGDGEGAAAPPDTTADTADAQGGAADVVREAAGDVGSDPFTTAMGDGDFTDEVAALPASADVAGGATLRVGTAPGLYGGTGEASRCDSGALVEFLEANADEADAWAGALGIATDEIAEYVATLEPLVLLHDTRVTNHGFSGGRATPFQSVLQAGTAVLVGATGVPRTRCACGNPLAPPQVSVSEEISGPSWPDEQTPHVVVPGPVVPVPAATLDGTIPDDASSGDFCTVWAAVEPTVAGGPSGADDTEAYIARLQDGFGRLVEAAEHTAGFPADALSDLTQYRDDLLAWSGTGTPGSTELRDRIEVFLPTWCDGKPSPDGDLVVEPDDPSAGAVAAACSSSCSSTRPRGSGGPHRRLAAVRRCARGDRCGH